MSRRHSRHNERIFGLDAVRASAIGMVLLGHLTWIMPQEYRTVNMLFSLLGFLGVEVFFVLSGFLIGKILFRQFVDGDFTAKALRTFLKRRWFRTLPNYYLVLCANIFIAIAIVGYDIRELWKYFFFLQNFSSKVPGFFPESWSLSIEEFAYLLLPLSMLAGIWAFRKSDKKRLFLKIVLILYSVFIGTKIVYSLNSSFTTLTNWNLYLKTLVIFRIDAICTGVIAAWIALVKRDFWYKTRWLAAFSGVCFGLLLVFGASIFGISIEKHPFFWNVFFLPMLSISIGAMLPLLSAWKSSPYGIGKPVTFISLISYSMYLLHYGVVMQLLHAFALADLGWKVCAALYLGLTVLLSALLYTFYERPIMDLRDRIR